MAELKKNKTHVEFQRLISVFVKSTICTEQEIYVFDFALCRDTQSPHLT